MKANELRIGNWVNCFGLPMRVEPNTILSLLEIENNKKICIDLSAIPLTDEILLKCGFEKHRTTDIYATHAKGLINVNDGLVFLVNNGFLNHIKHLHQLQNLYFALTGEELEVDL